MSCTIHINLICKQQIFKMNFQIWKKYWQYLLYTGSFEIAHYVVVNTKYQYM